MKAVNAPLSFLCVSHLTFDSAGKSVFSGMPWCTLYIVLPENKAFQRQGNTEILGCLGSLSFHIACDIHKSQERMALI